MRLERSGTKEDGVAAFADSARTVCNGRPGLPLMVRRFAAGTSVARLLCFASRAVP